MFRRLITGLTSGVTAGLNKNILVLIISLSMSQAVVVAMIATSTLAASTLTDKVAQAFWPIALQFTGLFAFSALVAYMMKIWGRKLGFSICAGIGMLSSALSVYALISNNFLLFCITAFFFGITAAGVQQYRFAAIEAANPGRQAVAISYVLTGGIVAAVIGARFGVWGQELIPEARFAGSYLMVFLLCLGSLLAIQFLKMPKVEEESQEQLQPQRSTWTMVSQPRFIVAVIAAMMGYGVMNFIMVATPKAMEFCGFSYANSSDIVLMHVLGMFVPSFFTGHLIQRFGVERIIFLGVVLNLLCVAINLHGVNFTNFSLALIALGIGWNFCFIGGTAMLAQCYYPLERAKAQAINETLVAAIVALTAIFSGGVLAESGWVFVNLSAVPAIWIIALSLLAVFLIERKKKSAFAA